MKTLLGILLGGICGLPIGFGVAVSLYWLSFFITYGQGEFSATVLLLWLAVVASPLLIMPLVGAVLGAKLARRPSA